MIVMKASIVRGSDAVRGRRHSVLVAAMLLLSGLVAWSMRGGATPSPEASSPANRDPGYVGSEARPGVEIQRRRADRLLLLVDANTDLAIASTALVVTVGDNDQIMNTDARGSVRIPVAKQIICSQVEGTFDPITIDAGEEDLSRAVSCRFQLRLCGASGCTMRLRALLPDGEGGSAVSPGPGGLHLGDVIGEWRGPGVHKLATTLRPLVLEVEGGTVSPAHPIWAGEVRPGKDQLMQVVVPTEVTPPRISAVLHGLAGASFELNIAADPVSAQVDYVLAEAPTARGAVELLAIKEFGPGHRILALAQKSEITPNQMVVRFEGLEPGGYVVRSSSRIEGRLRFAWQVVKLPAGAVTKVAEREGGGWGVLDVVGEARDVMLVHVDGGSVEGIAVGYPAIDFDGVRRLEGLLVDMGSLRFYGRRSGSEKRIAFDLAARSQLDLGDL